MRVCVSTHRCSPTCFSVGYPRGHKEQKNRTRLWREKSFQTPLIFYTIPIIGFDLCVFFFLLTLTYILKHFRHRHLVISKISTAETLKQHKWEREHPSSYAVNVFQCSVYLSSKMDKKNTSYFSKGRKKEKRSKGITHSQSVYVCRSLPSADNLSCVVVILVMLKVPLCTF